QLIAYSDTKIDLDVVRRYVTSQVAVGNGIVVCPTTVGWLIAIDRMRQSVMWAHRYLPRSNASNPERAEAPPNLAPQELNGTWAPSAPIITGNRVIFSPQDEPQLFCLNLIDGKSVWEKPKDRGLYVAGVFQDLVIVVGESEVNALRLSNGEAAWTTSMD